MEDKDKFVGIILDRNLWYEDHLRGFQRYLPVKASNTLQPLINLRLQ
jgi:hypothetical protein